MPTLFSSSNLQLPFVRPESSHSRDSSQGRLVQFREQFSTFFNGQSVIEPRPSPDSRPAKRPAPRLGVQLLSTNESNGQELGRSTHPMRRAPSSTHSMIDSNSSPPNSIRPLTPNAFHRRDRSAPTSRPRAPPRARTFPEPRPRRQSAVAEELHLVTRMSSRTQNSPPKKQSKVNFRRCTLSNIKNPRVRGKAISCLVSGALLAVVLAIYLALAISNPVSGQEFHVLLILIILLMTIIFCHSLIRLCMMVLRPEQDDHESRRAVRRMVMGGYANPERPIQITLARDEEVRAASIEEDRGKSVLPPPPAYGLWRSSVRMNPNLVYWQKVEARKAENSRRDLERGRDAGNRPPSYASEDGVGYVIDARPRRTISERLPVHPSERGRIGRLPSR